MHSCLLFHSKGKAQIESLDPIVGMYAQRENNGFLFMDLKPRRERNISKVYY